MSASRYIATVLLSFLILANNYAAYIDSPNARLFLQNPVGTANDHHVHDHLKHASKSMLWSERAKMMKKQFGHEKSEKVLSTRGRTLQIAGSRLPDCSHACGSCSPCNLVMISFTCALHIDDAESCPISYRCMCDSKSYPVP